jgi:hypothetical protein
MLRRYGRMKTYRVALVDVGERLPPGFCIDVLLRKLNALQKSFSFEMVRPIPAEVLQNPDLGGQWYYFRKIFEILSKHPEISKYDYLIGLTHVRLTEDEDSVDEGNRDYFSLSNLDRISLVTLNQNITDHNSPTKTIYQFIAFNILGELLCNLARAYLYHTDVRYCLFDECMDRGNVKLALQKSYICPECSLRLKKDGADEGVLRDANKILDWCRSCIGKHASWYRAISHPISSLAIGSAIGWAASAFFSASQYIYVIVPVLSIPLVLWLNYARVNGKHSG